MAIQPPADERRTTLRRNVRTPGASFVLCESSVRPIEVWTRNLSDGGVNLMSREELLGERVMLQLGLPAYQGKLIEARVRHRNRFDRALVSGELETMFYSGLVYVRVWEESGVHPSLLAAFDAPSDDPSDEQAPSARISDRSLVPLLSAIGMPAVYATMLPWS